MPSPTSTTGRCSACSTFPRSRPISAPGAPFSPSRPTRCCAKLTGVDRDGIVAAMRTRLALALLALVVPGGRAHAAGRERIALAVFNVTGEPIAEEQRAKLRLSLRGGLASGFEVVPDAEVER